VVGNTQLDFARMYDYTGVVTSSHVQDGTLTNADFNFSRMYDYTGVVKSTHMFAEAGSNGMFVIMTSSGLSLGTPVGGGGAGGNKNREINLPAESFYTDAWNNAYIDTLDWEETYANAVSSITSFYVVTPNSAKPNFAQNSFNMDAEYTDTGNATISATIVTTTTLTDNVWTEVGISSAPESTGSWVIYYATTAPTGKAYQSGVANMSITVTGSAVLRAGKDIFVNFGGNNSNPFKGRVYYKNVKFKYAVN
jgi:hypothetical protein